MCLRSKSIHDGQSTIEQLPTRGREFWRGVVQVAPLFLGAIPFGMIYGVLASNAGMGLPLAQSMSVIVFAGSAQFVMAQLLNDGTPLLVVALTAAILNVRHLLYSASIAPHLQQLSRPWKAVLAYLLTDEAYAVAITRFGAVPACDPSVAGSHPSRGPSADRRHWFVLGTGLGLWITWQLSTAVGILLGSQIPATWSLDFAVPLTFIALVVPALRDRASIAAALVAGIVVVLTAAFPLKLGLVVAMLTGIGAGWLLEQSIKRHQQRTAEAETD